MTQRLVVLLAPLAIACGSHTGNGDDSPDASTGFVEAPHGTTPELVSMGGKVLANPVVKPIFFKNDSAPQTQIEDFLQQLATSDYWTTVTSEYGVGKLTIAPTVVSADAPPTTDAALSAVLQKVATANPDPNTIYSVFLPAGTVL